MTRETKLTRRETLLKLIAGGGALSLSGCALDARSPAALAVLESAEALTRTVQRALLAPRQALAREYRPQDISSYFRPNGSTAPDDSDYQDALAANFADWRLEVGGLVDNPLKLSLTDLRALPSRTQITRHDCVEGWSCIAQWRGARLASVLAAARLKPAARFIAFYCADTLEQSLDGTGQYYETIDLVDATHPQTILATKYAGDTLADPFGYPLRLRTSTKLGYKNAKWIKAIEVTNTFSETFWSKQGFNWFAGI